MFCKCGLLQPQKQSRPSVAPPGLPALYKRASGHIALALSVVMLASAVLSGPSRLNAAEEPAGEDTSGEIIGAWVEEKYSNGEESGVGGRHAFPFMLFTSDGRVHYAVSTPREYRLTGSEFLDIAEWKNYQASGNTISLALKSVSASGDSYGTDGTYTPVFDYAMKDGKLILTYLDLDNRYTVDFVMTYLPYEDELTGIAPELLAPNASGGAAPVEVADARKTREGAGSGADDEGSGGGGSVPVDERILGEWVEDGGHEYYQFETGYFFLGTDPETATKSGWKKNQAGSIGKFAFDGKTLEVTYNPYRDEVDEHFDVVFDGGSMTLTSREMGTAKTYVRYKGSPWPGEPAGKPFSELKPGSGAETEPESKPTPTAKPEDELSEEAKMMREANDLLLALRKCEKPEDFAALGLESKKEVLESNSNIISYYSNENFPHSPRLIDMYVSSAGIEGMRYDQAYYLYSEDNDESSLALFNAAETLLLETYGESYARHMRVGDDMGTFTDKEVVEALKNGVRVSVTVYWRNPFGQPGEEVAVSLDGTPPGHTQVLISYSASE